MSIHLDETTHDLKKRIMGGGGVPDSPEWPFLRVSANRIEIWKCKGLKLSAKDTFSLTTKRLNNFKFSEDDDSDVQHLGVAQRMRELGLDDNELLLARVP